ncbi:MAG: FmdB family zinc ribbon protein [Chitinophagales bacterium]
MPTYEYVCPACGRFEEFQKITEPAITACPRCGAPVKRLISGGLGVIYKGSGYYTTENRSSEYKAKAKEESGHGSTGSSDGPAKAAAGE